MDTYHHINPSHSSAGAQRSRRRSWLALLLTADEWEQEAYASIRWARRLAGVAILAAFLAATTALTLIAGAACGAMP